MPAGDMSEYVVRIFNNRQDKKKGRVVDTAF
jgi:hypothetical protein